MDDIRSFHLIADDYYNSRVERLLRDIPPVYYTFKIGSFSVLSTLLKDAKLENYESDAFESGGFKWKLSLYPNGNKERNGEGYISLYLVIADTDKLPLGWEVYVKFKLFVYNKIEDKYQAFPDANGEVRRFHNMKTEWGNDQLLSIGTFNGSTNGYLVHDKCAFAVEVCVINNSGRWDSVAVLDGLDETYTWKVDRPSFLYDRSGVHYSDVFTLGNLKWKLWLYPRGDSNAEGNSLSLFIELVDVKSFPSDRKTLVKYLLRIKDQRTGKHEELKSTACFSPSTYAWGKSSFLSLERLHDDYAGFLTYGVLIIEAQIQSISTTVKNFSK